MPTFSNWPWIGDHPDDTQLANESYLLQDIVPFVDRLYPQTQQARFILGASKGGNAALLLLARHPGLFQGVSLWDSPLMKMLPDEWEMPLIYGSEAHYQQYAIPQLLQEHAQRFHDRVQIALHGFGMFREHMVAAHELMTALGIAHEYDNVRHRPHVWGSGWIEDTLLSLDRMR
jgi:enterochelin esterase-like enzyme